VVSVRVLSNVLGLGIKCSGDSTRGEVAGKDGAAVYFLIWTVLWRRMRQIVAFVSGNRSDETCRQLWEQTPTAYWLSTSRYRLAFGATIPAMPHKAAPLN
jgi:hypothetical protein